MKKQRYTPRPLRESHGAKSTAEIQRDIHVMRAAYARRMAESDENSRVAGWALVAIAIAVPAIAAAIYLLSAVE